MVHLVHVSPGPLIKDSDAVLREAGAGQGDVRASVTDLVVERPGLGSVVDMLHHFQLSCSEVEVYYNNQSETRNMFYKTKVLNV